MIFQITEGEVHTMSDNYKAKSMDWFLYDNELSHERVKR